MSFKYTKYYNLKKLITCLKKIKNEINFIINLSQNTENVVTFKFKK